MGLPVRYIWPMAEVAKCCMLDTKGLCKAIKGACGADWKAELGISKLPNKEIIHMPTASLRAQNYKSGDHTYDPQATRWSFSGLSMEIEKASPQCFQTEIALKITLSRSKHSWFKTEVYFIYVQMAWKPNLNLDLSHHV